jgi:hypothetical protein
MKANLDSKMKLPGPYFFKIFGQIYHYFYNSLKPKKDCCPKYNQMYIIDSEEANNIIKTIVTIYYNHRIQINLQPGDIIILDNNRVVHGRSSFIPKYDGTDRFLVRCFTALNYEKSKYARPNGSRMISAIYS